MSGQTPPPVEMPDEDVQFIVDAAVVETSKESFDWGWVPPVIVGIGVVGVALFVSTVTLLGFMILINGVEILTQPEQMQQWLVDFSSTEAGLIVVVLPGQFTFLSFALVGGLFSRDGLAERLMVKRGNAPILLWPVLVLGTPTVGLVMSLLLTWAGRLFDMEPSQQIQNIENMLTSFTGKRLALVIGLVAFLPGVSEELLFRGFVQNRLLKKWPPFAAIGFSAICFAFAHIDPMHMFVVLPIGVWLGIVAWRCDSIWPAILGHIVNNISAIAMTHVASNGMSEARTTSYALLASAPFFVLSVGFLMAMRLKAADD